MIGRRPLVLAAASVAVGGLAAWRAVAVRQGMYARVEGRLAETAALTRDGVRLWLEERERDARSAALAHENATAATAADARAADTEALEALRAGHGYAAIWRLDSAGAVLARARTNVALTHVERRAAQTAGRDGRLHVVGPFEASTPSGVAVSVASPVTRPVGAVVVLRRDPAATLLPLVVRRTRGSSEVGRLLAVDGDAYLMVSPAPGRGAGYEVLRGRVAGLPVPQQRVLRGVRQRASYEAVDGRPVLAGLVHVPGAPWTVVRRVDRAEIAATASTQLGTAGLLLVAALSAVGLGALAATRAERADRLREIATRETRLADSLRATEATARAFVEHAPDGVCRVAPDGRFTSVNPALVGMLAYPDAGTLLHADLGDLYLESAARAQILGRHAEGEAVVAGVETVWRRYDGGEVPVRLHSREVRDAHGGILYYEAYIADLGALRTAEQALRQALARFFGRRGWTVDEAGDGRAAFARLLEAEAAGVPYDLVLSDVRMAGVSGIVLHDWLARTRPALLERLVFATGDVASPESAAFVQRTHGLVLDKPFDPATLARRAVDGAVPVPAPDAR